MRLTRRSQSSGDRLLLITPATSIRRFSFGHGSSSQMHSQGLLLNLIQQLYDKDDTGEGGTKVYSLGHVSTLLKNWRKKMSADYQPSARLFIPLCLNIYRDIYLSIYHTILEKLG